MELLKNTWGSNLRDSIYNAMHLNKIKWADVKRNFMNCDIPKEYWGELLSCAEYRKYERTTDRVEQMFVDYVCKGIIKELLENDNRN